MDDLQVLLGIEEIRKLQAQYARYADEQRWADLTSLFAADGLFRSLDPAGDTVAEMAGRDQIQSSLAAVSQGDVTLIHQLFTAEIEIETPETAKAIWAMADIIIRSDEPPARTDEGPDLPEFRIMRGWGHYHNDYRRIDGRWLIVKSVQTRTRLEFE